MTETSVSAKADDLLAADLRAAKDRTQAIEDVLSTDDRVIARITDGIYRQPWSALRELISNSYDADATWVSVKTDAPKFSRMSVEDNGNGMSPEAVVHMLRHIGGSPKRTDEGQHFGVTGDSDVTLSPGGRKLIGKLGIGLFSVSQLTHSFQIITKTSGDDYRTIILVNLRQFADEPIDDDESEFEAGRFQVWREKASEIDMQGTTVVLTAIRPQIQDTLRSDQLWSAIDSPNDDDKLSKASSIVPLYHIGRLKSNSNQLVSDKSQQTRSLPWDDGDGPDESFKKMVDSVWLYLQRNAQTAKLSYIFDNYLQMIWNLSLSLPLPYVERNVFDEVISDDWAYFYRLSNKTKGTAEAISHLSEASSLREACGLVSGNDGVDFDVYADGIRLQRPLKYRDLPMTQHALKKPMIFVGSFREEFTGFERDVSAGPLEFEAYLFWTPKVAPTEHQGVLVRIHGSSGTLFDSTFFNYQISELTRLKQITCEIFVKQGLEAALNIDRESFNTAHPHTVVVTHWVHGALRQLATAQKREAQLLRHLAREDIRQSAETHVNRIVDAANIVRTDGEGVVPDVYFTRPGEPNPSLENIGISFELARIIEEIPSDLQIQPRAGNLLRLEAIAQLLSVYELLDQLSPSEQENLLGSILGILEANLGG